MKKAVVVNDTFKWDAEGKGIIGAVLRKDIERTKKWEVMFRNWKTFRKTKTKVVLDLRVKKGIPDAVRGPAWLYIINSESLELDRKRNQRVPDKRKRLYDHYLQKSEREVPDPFRIPGLRQKENDPEALVKLLRAYLNADPQVSYSPLMGYVASIFLGYMPIHAAFISYFCLMTSKKHKAHNYFKDPEVQEITRVWDILLKQQFPKIAPRFRQLSVDHTKYFPHWLQTAFLDVPCPPPIRLRVFDRFIRFGTRALFSFGLVVVRTSAQFLKRCTRKEDVVTMLSNPASDRRLSNWRSIINIYDQMFLTQKKFLQLLSYAECVLRLP
jgi:hypothetical protein